MAKLLFTVIEPHEMKVCVSELDEKYAADDRYIEWYVSNTLVYRMELAGGAPQSDVITFIGAPAFTTDTIKVIIYYNGGSVTLSETVTTRPEYFEFDTPKIKGDEFDLTADEWNGLCDNINQVIEWVGKSPAYYYPAEPGNEFEAVMLGQAKSLLDRFILYMTDEAKEIYRSIPSVQPGDYVKASYLNAVRDVVNSIKYPYE